MVPQKTFCNRDTGAVVHTGSPLRLFFYDHSPYAYSLLNPLVKALVHDDPRFSEGRYLFERCADPEHADFLVFPCDLNYFEDREDEVPPLLPFYAGNEHRHVFFDRRDRGSPLAPGTPVHFRASVHRRDLSPSVICVPYLEPVDNFFIRAHQRRDICYDLSFVGERTDFRERLVASLSRAAGDVYFRLRPRFYFGGYMACRGGPTLAPDVARAQRREYVESALRSRFVLAPMGYGTNSFRFFEALSLGVPPVLVSEDCALPFEDVVDYDAICLRFEASDPDLTERILAAVRGLDDRQYARMCKLGLLYFHTYLSPRNVLFLLHDALGAANRGRSADDASRFAAVASPSDGGAS